MSFGLDTFKQNVRVKKLSWQRSQADTCDVTPRLNTQLVKAVATVTSVATKTFEKDDVLEERVQENDGKAGNTINPYENIYTFRKTGNLALFNTEYQKASISICTVATEKHRVDLCLQHGAGPDLVKENFLRQGWHMMTELAHAQDMKSATSHSVCVLYIISLHVMTGDCRVRVDFGVVGNLVVPLLFVKAFIDRFVNGIFPVKWKEFTYTSKPRPIIMLTVQTPNDEQKQGQQEHSILFRKSDNVKSKKV